MARALLAAGARVAIWGSNPAKTAGAKAQLESEAPATAGRVHAFVCDVGDEAQVDSTFAASVAALGGTVHACFANAGVSGFGQAFTELGLDEFRRVLRINTEGVFLTLRAATRHMVAHGQGGSLVATASTAALEGAARNSHYGASKGAVVSFVRALAVELARHRIRVNALAPGYIRTDINADFFDSPPGQALIKRIPQRRLGEARELDGPLLLLASDAGSYMTGSVVAADGGHLVSGL
jgi:NAD(P)-dependent dehydrogenase (short-subunit alcohol dehydrogenase family)